MASVKWIELYRWSVVDVHFGTPKKDVDDLDCADVNQNYFNGINTNNQFSYPHMAIVISKNIKDSNLVVLPLTHKQEGDENRESRIVLKREDYNYFLSKDTSVLLDNITTIEKKVRIKRIILSYIPLPLRRKILRELYRNYKI